MIPWFYLKILSMEGQFKLRDASYFSSMVRWVHLPTLLITEAQENS